MKAVVVVAIRAPGAWIRQERPAEVAATLGADRRHEAGQRDERHQAEPERQVAERAVQRAEHEVTSLRSEGKLARRADRDRRRAASAAHHGDR